MADELLALVRRAETEGEPILRSLEYADPHQGYERITDEFMLGEDILVAPVLTKGTFVRDVVFPEGSWVAEDGTVYAGRNTHRIPSPLGRLLYFRRQK
jgi:alpha-glucosidase (family GH31 glycosyl hydrolase)